MLSRRNNGRIGLVFAVGLATCGAGARAQRGPGGVVAPDGAAVGKQWLFVIGIDKYQTFPDLRCCVRDAQAVRDVCRERYVSDHVLEIYNEQATRTEILQKLRYLAQHTKPEDSVFVYYAGHGHQDELLNKGFWLPHDATRNDATWIPNTYIRDYLNARVMKAKHVLLVSDSCFSGDFFSEARVAPRITDAYHRRAYAKTSRQAITSGGLEPVADGPFAVFFSRALRENGKPYITPSAIFERIKEGVALSTAQQTPLIGHIRGTGSEMGEFIFFLKPQPKVVTSGRDEADVRVGEKRVKDFGWIEIKLSPPDATLTLDGKAVTAGGRIQKDVGGYELRAAKAGYYTRTVNVEVDPFRTVVADIKLREMPRVGSIELRCNVEGAQVQVDGRPIGKTRRGYALTASDLPVGRHAVSATLDGYRDWRQDVTVRANEAEHAIILLERRAAVAGEARINPKDGAEMVYIPAGEFLMGADQTDNERIWDQFGWDKKLIEKYAKDEAPKHRVSLDGLWMYKHEVTVAQFQRFAEATGHKTEAEKEGKGIGYNFEENKAQWIEGASWRCPFEKGVAAKPGHPVVQVSWDDAQAYCRWASVRLPTEAEWEYAARGGNTGLAGKPHHAFVWGSDAPSKAVANMWDEAAARRYPKTNYLKVAKYDDGYASTAPVGTYPPNGFGLLDMGGNVYEWCSDWYGEDYYRQSVPQNPKGPSSGKDRVLRGGAWSTPPSNLRVAYRYRYLPTFRLFYAGFRCARTP